MKKQSSGWKGESRRHSLARKGIKTVLPDGRRFDVSKFVSSGQLDLAEYDPVKMVGDGNLPNVYWVSFSNYYYVENEDGDMVSIDEIDPDFKGDGGVVAVFSTFRDAMNYIDKYQSDIHVMVEDRLTGVIWESYKYERIETVEHWDIIDDTAWTKKHMKEMGVEFE